MIWTEKAHYGQRFVSCGPKSSIGNLGKKCPFQGFFVLSFLQQIEIPLATGPVFL
jgi:hypothetical protein